MTQYRKDLLKNGEVYHIFTRSISKFVVFNDSDEFDRIFQLLSLFRHRNFFQKFSDFSRCNQPYRDDIIRKLEAENNVLVEIVAFCIMPTHIHLVLKQIADDGISNFMSRILNGYSRYFNLKHKRTGPLWAGRFKNVLVEDDEQLLHLTRYVHLNPTSAGLVGDLTDWNYSSIHEYIKSGKSRNKLCKFDDLIDMTPIKYLEFVLDQKDYQKQLALIKNLLIDKL